MEQSGSGAQRGLSAGTGRRRKAHLQLLHGTKFSEDEQMENRVLPGLPSPGKHPGQMSSVLARQPPGSHRKTQTASPETDISVLTSSELLTAPSPPAEEGRCPIKSLRLALAKPQGSPRISRSPWSHCPAGVLASSAPTLGSRAVHTRTGRCLASSPHPSMLMGPELAAGSEPMFPACRGRYVGNSKVQGREARHTQGAVYMPEFQKPFLGDFCEN